MVEGKIIEKLTEKKPEIVDLEISIGTFQSEDENLQQIGDMPLILLNCKNKEHLSKMLVILSNMITYDSEKFENNLDISLEHINKNYILEIKATQNKIINYKVNFAGEFKKKVTLNSNGFGVINFLKEYDRVKSYMFF
jgi:hypothetical protein